MKRYKAGKYTATKGSKDKLTADKRKKIQKFLAAGMLTAAVVGNPYAPTGDPAAQCGNPYNPTGGSDEKDED